MALSGLIVMGSAGCSAPMLHTGIQISSFERSAVLKPAIRSSGYRAEDDASATIFLSDIPLEELAAADSLDSLTGSLIEIHSFLTPKPGKTPIDTTASTTTIRLIVFADGQFGLYGGGGFLFPKGQPGDSTFGGRIKHGSVRFLAATSGFADRLGAAEFDAGFTAPEDDAAVATMSHIFNSALRVLETSPAKR